MNPYQPPEDQSTRPPVRSLAELIDQLAFPLFILLAMAFLIVAGIYG